MTSGAPIPPGLAIPIAIVGMIVVAAHAQALAKRRASPRADAGSASPTPSSCS